MTTWPEHLYHIKGTTTPLDAAPDTSALRQTLEPWLAALFQSEHLALLVGNGLTTGVAHAAGVTPPNMDFNAPSDELGRLAAEYATTAATQMGRGRPNLEDYLRASTQLMTGLFILKDSRAPQLQRQIDLALQALATSVLKTEQDLQEAISSPTPERQGPAAALDLLLTLLLSMASRSASRERLHIFTTNYDRLIEYAADTAGLRTIDRFVGTLNPTFRTSRLDVDLHYNPPGIRGEPRYLEGVIRLTKLHGSIDWRFGDRRVYRADLPFGAAEGHPTATNLSETSLAVFPNAAKDFETTGFPYAELFRDFAASVCRPNSVLVTYGYGYGDSHINHIIGDMLTIPSTHLVIISYDHAEGRVERFWREHHRPAQTTLLIGSVLGSLKHLAEDLLPKAALDTISYRETELLQRRAVNTSSPPHHSRNTPTGDDAE